MFDRKKNVPGDVPDLWKIEKFNLQRGKACISFDLLFILYPIRMKNESALALKRAYVLHSLTLNLPKFSNRAFFAIGLPRV